MQVNARQELLKKLEQTEDYAHRKALKAAIYMTVERTLESRLGKSVLYVGTTTGWVGNGIVRNDRTSRFEKDARKSKRVF